MVYEQGGIGAVIPCSNHSVFTPFPAVVGLIFAAPRSLSTHAG